MGISLEHGLLSRAWCFGRKSNKCEGDRRCGKCTNTISSPKQAFLFDFLI